jgi:hypothetical protein
MRTAPKTKHTIPLEQFQKQNIPYHENSSKSKTYHTMRTAPKNKKKKTMRTAPKKKHTMKWEQIQKENIPYHENSSKNKTYQTMRTAPKTKHTIP